MKLNFNYVNMFCCILCNDGPKKEMLKEMKNRTNVVNEMVKTKKSAELC